MSYDKIIPITFNSGNQYLLTFGLANFYDLFPVVDVSLLLVKSISTNSIKDLSCFSDNVYDYLLENDVILYYYCDLKDLNRRDERITPQEYRFNLFNTLFKKANKKELVLKPVIIADKDEGDHYIALITFKRNQNHLDAVIKELDEFNK